jgi:hypothetical protein
LKNNKLGNDNGHQLIPLPRNRAAGQRLVTVPKKQRRYLDFAAKIDQIDDDEEGSFK